jgi:predicted NAD/FAD-binding protein
MKAGDSGKRVVRVAVIGSGLAGLTAAALLSSQDITSSDNVKFECHLFEKVRNV